MGRPRLSGPIKYCRNCDKRLVRRRFSNGQPEDRTAFRKRKYCDRACMAAGYTGQIKVLNAKNSRKQAARKRKSGCEQCGSRQNLHVHHADENPLNNTPSNLVTLCASCHQRWHRHHGKETSKRAGPCRICGKPSRKKGYCQKHYLRFRKYGDPCLTKKKGGLSAIYREMPDGSYVLSRSRTVLQDALDNSEGTATRSSRKKPPSSSGPTWIAGPRCPEDIL